MKAKHWTTSGALLRKIILVLKYKHMRKKLWLWAFCGSLAALVSVTAFSFLPAGAIAPAVLTGTCASGISPRVNLSWDPVPDQNSNAVQRRVDGGDWDWAPNDFELFSYTDSSVSNGHFYTYRIKTDPQVASNEFTCDFMVQSSQPSVTTGNASNVSVSGATISGTVNPNGAATDAWFEYDVVSSDLGKSTSRMSIGSGSGAVSQSATLTGLLPGTTYYFKTVAINSHGQSSGSVNSFRTSDSAVQVPIVVTGSAGSITATGATISGTVNPNGAATDAWFEYGSSNENPSSATSRQSLGSGTSVKNISAALTGLASGATHYYRVVGRNASGDGQGTIKSFTTLTVTVPPVVNTGSASSVTHNSAILSGSVNPKGSSATAWFEYRVGSNGFLQQTSAQSVGSGNSYTTTNQNISGLSSGSSYQYRAVAQSSAGKTEGAFRYFSTGNEPPSQTPILTVEPNDQSVQTGSEIRFHAYYDSDGLGPMGRTEVTGSAVWESGNTGTAESLGNGTYRGKSAGGTTISARFGGNNTAATLRVLQSSVTTSTRATSTIPVAGKPVIYTKSAQDVSKTYALLTGLVNPNGAATKAWFEYGKSKSVLDQSTEQISFSAGKTMKSVSAPASIAPSVLYYFRAVAQSSYGTSRGEILEVASAGRPTLLVEPSVMEIEVGQRAAFRAYYDSDGSGSAKREDITKKVNWVSSDTMILTYEKNGEFVAKNGGDVRVTAVYNSSGVVKSIYDLDNINGQAGVTVLGDASWLNQTGGVSDVTLGDGNSTGTSSESSGAVNKGGLSGWTWFLILLLIIVIAAIVIFVIWKKRQDNY